MADEKLLTFTERLYECEKHWPDFVMMKQPVDGVYRDFTWKEAMLQARKMAAFLKGLGLSPGDRISILSKNCAEWVIADMAVTLGGFVNVPFFPNQSGDIVSYIIEHAEVKLIFVGKLDNWKIQEPHIPSHVIRIDFPYDNPMPAQYHWNDILAQTKPGFREQRNRKHG